MKKFLTLLLALAIVFAMAIPTLAAPVNHAKDAEWVVGPNVDEVTVANGVATATSSKWYEWSSPLVDVLPALKAALGNGDEVTVTISLEVRATAVAGSEGISGTARLLFRGVNGLPELAGGDNQDAWNEAYYEALDGEAPFFNNDGGNIIQYAGTMAEIKDSDWALVTTTITLYAAQINNDCVTAWNLCLDKNSVYKDLQSLQFRNLSVIVAEPEAEPTEAPADPTEAPANPTEAPADATATATATATTAPTATATATATSGATATEAPANDDNGGSPAILIAAIIAAVVIAGCVVAVIVIKKKKAK